MSGFTTRVELYGTPSKEDYARLHAAMEAKKFNRFIVENGRKYQLPHAEYLAQNALTTLQILALAKEAASTVWKDYCVFVTRTEVRWEHYNLKPLL